MIAEGESPGRFPKIPKIFANKSRVRTLLGVEHRFSGSLTIGYAIRQEVARGGAGRESGVRSQQSSALSPLAQCLTSAEKCPKNVPEGREMSLNVPKRPSGFLRKIGVSYSWEKG